MDVENYLNFLSRNGIKNDQPYPIENCKTMTKEELKENILEDLKDNKASTFFRKSDYKSHRTKTK